MRACRAGRYGPALAATAVVVAVASFAHGAHKVVERRGESSLPAAIELRRLVADDPRVLGAEVRGRVSFIVVVTDDVIQARGLKAGEIVKQVAEIAGGSGGGRPHMAQAGGRDASKIDEALGAAAGIVRRCLVNGNQPG